MVPWGRRLWVGINFCHPEVVKLQQQCHMQNTIFDLPPPPPPPLPPANCFYSFFLEINTLIFGVFMTLGRHSGFRHVPGETGTTLQKCCCCYLVVSQGNSGNKVGKW